MNYIERPRAKGGGFEASLDGGKTWRRLLPVRMTAGNAQKCYDGAKTQTRRLVAAPDWWEGHLIYAGSADRPEAILASRDGSHQKRARYSVGDILYIQEPWRTTDYYDKFKPACLPDDTNIFHEGVGFKFGNPGKLRPAMFMQLRFSRPARYEVTAVRAERANVISEADALAEGVSGYCPFGVCGGRGYLNQVATVTEPPECQCADMTPQEVFGHLWNSIYFKPGTRFNDGPWTWPYTFRRVR